MSAEVNVFIVTNPFKVEIESRTATARRAAHQIRSAPPGTDVTQMLKVYEENVNWLAARGIPFKDDLGAFSFTTPSEKEEEILDHLERLTRASEKYDAVRDYWGKEAARHAYNQHFDWLTEHHVNFWFDRALGQYVQVAREP